MILMASTIYNIATSSEVIMKGFASRRSSSLERGPRNPPNADHLSRRDRPWLATLKPSIPTPFESGGLGRRTESGPLTCRGRASGVFLFRG